MPPLHDRPEADPPEMPDAEPETEQQTGARSGDQGQSGWSGRAVGPLSGLLPGGAVELDADELPVSESDPQPAGEASPLPRLDEDAEVVQAHEEDLTATEDRWHAALFGFVDSPRGSVEAARALIDEDIAVLIALLARRREAMHALWPAEQDADTEALRVALVNYRDLRNRLADVITALTA